MLVSSDDFSGLYSLQWMYKFIISLSMVADWLLCPYTLSLLFTYSLFLFWNALSTGVIWKNENKENTTVMKYVLHVTLFATM